MIKAVIFDWGGVMALRDRRVTADKIAEVLGVDKADVVRLWNQELGKMMRGLVTEGEFWRSMARELGAKVPHEPSDVWSSWEDMEPETEMVEFAHKLKQSGLKVAVLSNVFAPVAETIRLHHGFDGFDAINLSCELGYAKPDYEIYTLAVRSLDLEASECIIVDDQMPMLAPAWAMGMKTILGVNPTQVIRDVTQALQ